MGLVTASESVNQTWLGNLVPRLHSEAFFCTWVVCYLEKLAVLSGWKLRAKKGEKML